MTTKTFTEDEIRDRVMGYHEGCAEGKIDFLRDEFGIEPKELREWVGVECTIQFKASVGGVADSEGEDFMLDPDSFASCLTEALQNVLDNSDIVAGNSAYVVRGEPYDGAINGSFATGIASGFDLEA